MDEFDTEDTQNILDDLPIIPGTEGRTLTEGRAQALTEGRAQALTEGRAQALTEGRAQALTEGRAYDFSDDEDDILELPRHRFQPPAPIEYLVNDENTLQRLYGSPVLPWETDLSIIEDIQKQVDHPPINPRAKFQDRKLHPTYAPRPAPRLTLPFRRTGNIPIPGRPTGRQFIGRTSTVPTLPAIPKERTFRPIIPSPANKKSLPTIPGTEKKFNSAINRLPRPSMKKIPPVPPPPRTLVRRFPPVPGQKVVPLPKPGTPTVPKPRKPTVPKPRTRDITGDKPKIPTPRAPTIPKPTIPKPTIPKPTIPKPTVPTRTISPTPRAPTIPKPTIPKPTIPKPTIPKPTIPKPTIPKPTIPKPTIPKPTIPKPTIPKPTVPTRTISPTPRTPKILPIPPVRGTPKIPKTKLVIQDPNVTIGRQVSGYTTIIETDLRPIYPNRRGEVDPPNQPRATVGKIKLPIFNTLIPPPRGVIKRPVPFPEMNRPGTYVLTPGTDEYKINILNEIDPELLNPERIGKHKRGYSRNALIDFVRRLGLTPSGKNKASLIAEIQKMRQNMGLA